MTRGRCTIRGLFAIGSWLLGVPLIGAQQISDEEMQKIQEAFTTLGEAFAADPDARVPVEGLPAYVVERLDFNGDGFIAGDEMERMRSESRKPRDRSDFTMLHEEGFPLNVDPEIVSADDAEIGDDDIVLGVVRNGQARAYPVNYMNGPNNEVVNDTLGDEPIVSSW